MLSHGLVISFGCAQAASPRRLYRVNFGIEACQNDPSLSALDPRLFQIHFDGPILLKSSFGSEKIGV